MSNFSICPYCSLPAGKSELGYILAIHPEHQAGTPFWARWYRRERDAGRRRTEVGDALLELIEARVQSSGVGLARMHELNKKQQVKGVNPGLLRMQELNRLRKEERLAKLSL